MKKIISKNAPAALGPYSQAIEVNNLIFVSGQLPIDSKNNIISSEIKEATKLCFENIENILIEAKVNLENVIKVNIFLKDLENFQAMNEVYATFFSEPYPARACVEVARLPKDSIIEIECIAYKK